VRLLIDDLTFDLEARRLVRGRDEIHLSPKAFELLKTLIEQRPRALSKRELHEQLWPATFVSETNLANLIAEVRDALGETARQPRFIRTVHRFGYAFSGNAVEAPGARPVEGVPANEPLAPTGFCWLLLDGKRLPLRTGENILGREPDEGIRIDSPTVSRRHARISVSADAASLEDLQSKNGTFLAGEPVTAAVPLADGDEIGVGSVVLRFRMRSRSTATWSKQSARQRRPPVQHDGNT
jgi:DNA-binding winged helix-turn-helix (wHTH) protein